MKLNNVIILTIADFRRHFNFPAFWNSRKSFIRDMNPEKLSFYTHEDKENFDKIAAWINAEQNQSNMEEVRKSGLSALSLFAKCNVTEKDLKKVIGMLDYTASIIYAPSNGVLNLPGECMSEKDAKDYAKSLSVKEKLHKIEIEGENLRFASIYIDGREMCILKNDECVYATEINGTFLRLLDNRLANSSRTLYLENCPGKFESTLIEERFSIGTKVTRHEGVTQFGFVNGKPFFSNAEYVDELPIENNGL